MPIHFGPVAPYCPTSRDSPVGPGQAPDIKTSIPIARDLSSAIAAANALRNIITQIVTARVINNVHTYAARPDKNKNMTRISRWSEVKSKRIKRTYKYWGKDKGDKDKDENIWITTERIERMVWYDRAWKTYLTFEYPYKGEGEPQGNPSNAAGQQVEPLNPDPPPPLPPDV